MNDLLWPGAHRAGTHCTDAAVLTAAVAVERAWWAALAAAGLAPPPPAALAPLRPEEVAELLPVVAAGAEDGGNLVLPLLRVLRERAGADGAWLHRGLTSQDVLDTALQLCLRDAVAALRHELDAQVGSLAGLAERHRHTVVVARTLTQQALPTTMGLRIAGWLAGVLDARDALAALPLPPAQFGGAVGTLAALAELADPAAAVRTAADAAHRLGLAPSAPWHTRRTPLTRTADALVAATDAYGHLANDVLTLSRNEIAEVREPGSPGRGGSSAMPHKRNPALSVLLRRTATTAPGLLAQVHLAAADTGDERPAGAWHTEWPALATLARASLAAGRQATELVRGLEVDAAAARANLDAALPAVLAERLVPRLAALASNRGPAGTLGTTAATDLVAASADVPALRAGLAEAVDLPAGELAALLSDLTDPARYLGAADAFLDVVLERAAAPSPGGTP